MSEPQPGPIDRGAVARLLEAVASGSWPPADGATEVLPEPPGPVAGLLAFSGHHVVAADVDPAWVAEQLPVGDYGAPVSAPFLDALAARLGRTYDNLDHVLVADAIAGPPELELRPLPLDHPHPRLVRARGYRSELRAFETVDGAGMVLVGRGLARRWEAAFEVDASARGRGLGRALVTAARHLVPAGGRLWLQVAPGNAASLRTVLAAGGWTPVGAEVLFPRP